MRDLTSRMKQIFYDTSRNEITSDENKMWVPKYRRLHREMYLLKFTLRMYCVTFSLSLSLFSVEITRSWFRDYGYAGQSACWNDKDKMSASSVFILSTILPLCVAKRVLRLPNVRHGRLSALPENKPTAFVGSCQVFSPTLVTTDFFLFSALVFHLARNVLTRTPIKVKRFYLTCVAKERSTNLKYQWTISVSHDIIILLQTLFNADEKCNNQFYF